MKRHWKRTLSVLLSIAMLFGMTGMNAVFATEGAPPTVFAGNCGECNGIGEVDCTTCPGDGELTCQTCGGTGDYSHDGIDTCDTCNESGTLGFECSTKVPCDGTVRAWYECPNPMHGYTAPKKADGSFGDCDYCAGEDNNCTEFWYYYCYTDGKKTEHASTGSISVPSSFTEDILGACSAYYRGTVACSGTIVREKHCNACSDTGKSDCPDCEGGKIECDGCGGTGSGDTTPPTIVSVTPSGTGAPLSGSVVVTFSEPMDTGAVMQDTSGQFYIGYIEVTNNPFVQVQGQTRFSWSADKTVVTCDYQGLAPDTEYTIRIAYAVDLAGNHVTQDEYSTYTFTTGVGGAGDTTPPTVASVTPDGTNASLSGNVVITFSEEIKNWNIEQPDPISFDVVVSATGESAISKLNYSWDTAHTKLTIAYSSLSPSTTYKVVVENAKDAAGNVLSKDESHSFTTGAADDATKPTVVSVTPDGTDAPLSGNVVVTFSEPMNTTNTIYGSSGLQLLQGANYIVLNSLSWSENNTVLTGSYAGLAPNTEYKIQIMSWNDVAGNEMTYNVENNLHQETFTTAAAPAQTWNGDGASLTVADNDTITITSTATGTLAIPDGATVTIVGTVTGAGQVHLALGTGAKVNWAASYTGSSDYSPLVQNSGPTTGTIEITGSIINTGTDFATGISAISDVIVTGGTVSGQLYGVAGKNVTINTGSMITSTSDAAVAATNDLIINGGTITGGSENGNAAMVAFNGSVTLAGGTITAYPGARAVSSDTVTVTGAVAISGNVGITDSQWPSAITVGAGGALTVPQGGTLTVTNTGTIVNNGAIVNNGSIVNNGTITNHAGSTYTGANPTGTGTFTPPPVTTYLLTVTNGTGGGSYEAGQAVTITANPAPDGQRFKEWSVSPEPTFAEGTSKTSQTAKFAMPAQSVNATAVYESIPTGTTAVTGVTLNRSSLSLYSNATPNTAALTATVYPADATDKSVTWASGNTAVATVDQSGKVTAVGNGTATITATTTDGGYTASCTVSVSTYSSGGGNGGGGTPSVTVPVSSNEGSVSVSATVSNGTASVTVTDAQLAKVVSNSETIGTVTVDVSGLKNVDRAKIPAKVVKTADEAKGANALEVILPTGTVELDAAAVEAINTGKDITISFETVSNSKLTTAQKEVLGDQANTAIVVDVNVLVNGVKTSSFGSGTLTISIPYTPKSGEDTSKLTVWYIKDDGTIENMGGRYDAKGKCFVFETTHLSRFVLVTDDAVKNPFTDAAEKAWFYDDVMYVFGKGLMQGTSATTFSPRNNTTRGMIVTILYRLEKEPAVSGLCPFNDVANGQYYEKAIIWAAANNIVSGYGAGKFGPDDAITREQMAAILYRYAQYKDYDVSGSADLSKFTDNSKISGYAEAAMSWTNAVGLITGKGDGILDPGGEAERCQVAAILHRFCENIVK